MKIAFSCVVDSKPHFEWQAFILIQSLLRNVKCDPVDIKVHCSPGVTQAFRMLLAKLKIDAIDIQPFDGHPYCNKIQQCFSGVFDAYDKVVLADCDMFFCSLPDMDVNSVFSAKVVDLPNPPIAILDEVFQAAGMDKPKQVLVDCALSDGDVTYENNFNGGLYIVKREHLSEIGTAWKEQARWLLEHLDLLTPDYQHHADQVAMSLALSQLGVKPNLLSAQDNFPVHLEAERIQPLSKKNIKVIHYHKHLLPDGRIKPTGIPETDLQIIHANHEIEAILQQDFDNELFWSMRYELFPDLGSGVGSRGDMLSLKQHLLTCSLEGFMDKQVIDIGCGDLELGKVFDFQSYTGYDLSAQALRIAKKQRPEWNFVHGSITDHPAEHADVVICLDVLIHQKTRNEYLKLIKALAETTRQRLIISGYDALPPDEYTSEICAYHESLSKSLRDLGVFNEIIAIGEYRGLSFIVADKNSTGPARHQHDLPINEFERIVKYADRKDLLRLIMDTSRKQLGFYTKTSIRSIEYPWVLEKIIEDGEVTVADIGAGVSPLPIVLGQRGCSVTTLDFHSITRDLNNREDWNEWGFLDYSTIMSTIDSYNMNVLKYRPKKKYDVIYSVSVIEHMPKKTWEQVVRWAAQWLKPGGRLILTLDLIPASNQLWNYSEGVEVESIAQHGALTDFRATLQKNNFVENEFRIIRDIPFSRTDLALFECELNVHRSNMFRNLVNKIKIVYKHDLGNENNFTINQKSD